MVQPVGTDASELLRNWRLLGLAGHEPSGAKVIPLVVLRRQVLCQVRYIVPWEEMTLSVHMMKTKLELKWRVTIEKPAADMAIPEPADINDTATRTVKRKRRRKRHTKISVYYTRITCDG